MDAFLNFGAHDMFESDDSDDRESSLPRSGSLDGISDDDILPDSGLSSPGAESGVEEEGGYSGADEEDYTGPEVDLDIDDFLDFPGGGSDFSADSPPGSIISSPLVEPLELSSSNSESSPESARSRTWTVDSHSESEDASSPDSLFVEQHRPLIDRLAFGRIEDLQQQARELRQQHAELVQIHQNLQRTLGQASGRQQARLSPPPLIPQRRRRDDFDASALDELVEMEVVGARTRRANRTLGPARPAAGAAVIDLTDVPDSPEDIVVLPNPPNPRNRHRNPRRQGLNQRTPSLARSDGSILGAPVIDLTGMDDDAPAPANGPPDRAAQNPPPRRRAEAFVDLLQDDDDGHGLNNTVLGIVRRTWGMRNGLADLNIFQRILGQPAEVEVQIVGRNFEVNNRNNAPVPNPLAENLPNFNYRANGYNNGPPKPPYIAPPPAPEGFTRNTGEDLVCICPNCEEELKYDPDEQDAKAPPAKKARNRKDREEHHFWAVKECGHVFCKTCFEHRKPSPKNPHNSKFRLAEGPRAKLHCAVDGCPSEVSSKTAWVGLFL